VTIHRLAIRSYHYPELKLDIECGSGTYVRSLGRDLAAALGTGAVMSALERTAVGSFHVQAALALDDVSPETVQQLLQPAVAAVSDLPRLSVTDDQVGALRHGRRITLNHSAGLTDSEYAAIDTSGQLVGILREKSAGEFWPHINLF
jgi:tRNA pseudouridine55 synthase